MIVNSRDYWTMLSLFAACGALCGGSPTRHFLLKNERERDKTGAIPALVAPRRTGLAVI